jgi:hypothetical protein
LGNPYYVFCRNRYGLEAIKVLYCKDGRSWQSLGTLARHHTSADNAEKAYQEALKAAGVKAEDVTKIVAHRQGKYDVPLRGADNRAVIAARRRVSSARRRLRRIVGADETIVATLGVDSKINESCSTRNVRRTRYFSRTWETAEMCIKSSRLHPRVCPCPSW